MTLFVMPEPSVCAIYGVSAVVIVRANESGFNVSVKNEHLVTDSVNDIIWKVIIKTTEI
jgi:hypothetical protein